MTTILLTGFGLCVILASIWAVGVAFQGDMMDHEEIRRREAEWEEME